MTVTLVDGLVLARSAFHHSMNYRSAVVLGRAVEVRGPNESEMMKATLVLGLPLEEASAKIRSGGPIDDEEDYGIRCWAGQIPLRTVPQAPIADGRVPDGVAPSGAVLGYRRPGW